MRLQTFILLVVLFLTMQAIDVNAGVYDCESDCSSCVLRDVVSQCASDYTVIESQLYPNNVCIPSGTGHILTNCSSTLSYCQNHNLSDSILSYCSNSKLHVVSYSGENCSGIVTSSQYSVNASCLSMQSSFCVQLTYGRETMFVALSIFSLYIGICFSVFASLPCIICKGGDRRAKYISKKDNGIIAEDTVSLEISRMGDENGPGSPSTISEYATSTFRGNAILTSSCLVGSTCLLMLHALSRAVEGSAADAAPKWLRISCYILISLIGFCPSSPPSSIHEKTAVALV